MKMLFFASYLSSGDVSNEQMSFWTPIRFFFILELKVHRIPVALGAEHLRNRQDCFSKQNTKGHMNEANLENAVATTLFDNWD